MRIGLVTKYLERAVGHGTYAGGLLGELPAAAPGSSFHLYLPRAPRQREWPANVSIRVPSSPPRGRAGLAAWELVGVPRSAARDGVELIHYLYPSGPLWPARRPVVVGLFDTIEWTLPRYRRSRPERALMARQLRRADRVIVPSAEVADSVGRVVGLPASKLTVTPLAGPPVSPPSPSRLPYLLFVGGCERRKNLRSLLTAFSAAELGPLRLKVVGGTGTGARFETREELESLVPRARRERIEWLGEVDAAQLKRLYGEATALVYPTSAEGFGYPVLEAAAASTPVIASRVPSIAPGFEDAVALVDPADATGLRRQLERVASDRALRERLVERGRALAGNFSWRHTAALTLGVYRELLD